MTAAMCQEKNPAGSLLGVESFIKAVLLDIVLTGMLCPFGIADHPDAFVIFTLNAFKLFLPLLKQINIFSVFFKLWTIADYKKY